MVMASWPATPGPGHRGMSPATRRRLRLAQRRTVSAAVVGTALVLVLLLAADATWILVRIGEAARPMALVELGTMVAALGVAEAARRALVRPEWLSLALLGGGFGVMLARIVILPDGPMVPIALAASILAGSGAMVAWSRRWHVTWVAGAVALTLGLVTVTPFELVAFDRLQLAVAVGAAGVVSILVHWHVQPRLERSLALRIEVRQLVRHTRHQEEQIEELNRELVRTARIDTVTGIGNRRALDEALAAHAGQRLAVVLLDLDHFKDFNDRNGHLAGDAALARMGELLRATVRENDLVFRYGGEEFLILMPGVQLVGAGRLAERVRRTVEDDPEIGAGGLTISAGVAVADRFNSANPIPLLRRADVALYQAKRLGRNRVVIDGDRPSPTLTVVS
jgi:diguanylate cyclase (GGDEF)-like protein